MKIDLELATKVLSVVDVGLVKGVGVREPGKMCVEAAVCYAMGEPHGDEPTCVDSIVRRFKIRLNDYNWSSNLARTKGLRRIAIAQLGSNGVIDKQQFCKIISELTIRKIVPIALLAAASIKGNSKFKIELENAAKECQEKGTRESVLVAKKIAATAAATAAADAAIYAAIYAATAAADAATAAIYAATDTAASAADASAAADAVADVVKKDELLLVCAEIGIEALRQCNSPGIEFMDILCPL